MVTHAPSSRHNHSLNIDQRISPKSSTPTSCKYYLYILFNLPVLPTSCPVGWSNGQMQNSINRFPVDHPTGYKPCLSVRLHIMWLQNGLTCELFCFSIDVTAGRQLPKTSTTLCIQGSRIDNCKRLHLLLSLTMLSVSGVVW